MMEIPFDVKKIASSQSIEAQDYFNVTISTERVKIKFMIKDLCITINVNALELTLSKLVTENMCKQHELQ